MDVKEMLAELLTGYSIDTKPDVEYVVDHLISHGVTVQEWGGCEYCKGEFIGENPIVTLGNGCDIDSIVEDRFLYNFCDCGIKSIVKINFCPMCGQRLSQPPKGEQE